MEANPAYPALQVHTAQYHQHTLLGWYTAVFAISLIVILSALLAANRLLVAALQQPASQAAPAAGQPPSLTGPLSRYLEQGARVRYCQPPWARPEVNPANLCQDLGPTSIPTVQPARLAVGDVALVHFSASTPNLSTLFADWGMPAIVYLADGGAALTWHHPTLGLNGWMAWGDPMAYRRQPSSG